MLSRRKIWRNSSGVLHALRSLLDLIFPPVCALCGDDVSGSQKGASGDFLWKGWAICGECLKEVNWLRPPFCPRCAMPMKSGVVSSHLCGDCLASPPPFSSARALLVYGDEVFPLLHRMKYGPEASLARFMGVLLARHFLWEIRDLGIERVVPIPLHKKRLVERGFNQAALMARPIARALEIPLELRCLVKVRPTSPQVGLKRSERVANLKGAFAVTEKARISGKRLLLVDDVYTTGTTLSEASRCLLKAGAKEVHVITFARVS